MDKSELISYILIILVVIIIRTFIITPARVVGGSMEPNLSNKDIVILNKLDKNYERFDVVVVKIENAYFVKRLVGFENEELKYEDTDLYINDEKIEETFKSYGKTEDFSYGKIEENKIYILGDNRDNSVDSRRIGTISEDDIVGKVVFRLYPFNKIEKIK